MNRQNGLFCLNKKENDKTRIYPLFSFPQAYVARSYAIQAICFFWVCLYKSESRPGFPTPAFHKHSELFFYIIVGVAIAKSFLNAMEKVLAVNKERNPYIGSFIH